MVNILVLNVYIHNACMHICTIITNFGEINITVKDYKKLGILKPYRIFGIFLEND